MFEKKTDEMLSTESNWDIIIHHQEQWQHPTGGGVTARANTTINVSSPVIYYDSDDKYTDHIKDKIETVDPAAAAAKVCHIVVRYFNNHSHSPTQASLVSTKLY